MRQQGSHISREPAAPRLVRQQGGHISREPAVARSLSSEVTDITHELRARGPLTHTSVHSAEQTARDKRVR
jgi:hypothetical protein